MDISEGVLDLHLLWTSLPVDAYSYSIQLIDDVGTRALGEDFVIGLEPLAHHRIDTSSLTAGDYLVKMILYDYESGASVSGIVVTSQSRFERAHEIAKITTARP